MAVLARPSRASPTAASSSASRSPAATSASTTRPATCRSTRRRSSPCMGVIDDVGRRVPSGWQDSGDNLYLLGSTHLELDGSAWAGVIHGHLGGRPPKAHLKREKELAELLAAAAHEGLLNAAHDLADGGLGDRAGRRRACASASARGSGSTSCSSATRWMPLTALFSESGARAIVAVPREEDVKFLRLCEGRGYPVARIGVTDRGADGAGAASRCRTCSRSRSTSCAPPPARRWPSTSAGRRLRRRSQRRGVHRAPAARTHLGVAPDPPDAAYVRRGERDPRCAPRRAPRDGRRTPGCALETTGAITTGGPDMRGTVRRTGRSRHPDRVPRAPSATRPGPCPGRERSQLTISRAVASRIEVVDARRRFEQAVDRESGMREQRRSRSLAGRAEPPVELEGESVHRVLREPVRPERAVAPVAEQVARGRAAPSGSPCCRARRPAPSAIRAGQSCAVSAKCPKKLPPTTSSWPSSVVCRGERAGDAGRRC